MREDGSVSNHENRVNLLEIIMANYLSRIYPYVITHETNVVLLGSYMNENLHQIHHLLKKYNFFRNLREILLLIKDKFILIT